MATLAALVIKLEGDIAGLQASMKNAEAALDRVEKKGSGLGGALKSIGTTAAGVFAGGALLGGVQQLGGFLMSAAQAAAEDQAATDRLNQSLSNYVERSGIAEKGTQNFSYAMEELKGDMDERIAQGAKLAFTDDQIRDSMQSLLAATDDYGEAGKRQAAAMDLARGAGISLETATKMLGKINAENVEVFRKMGIVLGENATEADALAAVQAKFGGQAEAYAKSTAGQMESAKIRIGELKESLGAQLLPVLAAVMTFMVDTAIPALEKFAQWVGPEISKAIAEMRPHVEAIVEFIKTHWPEIQAVAGVVFDFVKAKIEGFIEQAKAIIEIVTSVVNIVSALFHGDWSRAWEEMKDIAGATIDLFLATLKAQFGSIPGIIAGLATDLFNAGLDLANQIIQGVRRGLENFSVKVGFDSGIPGVPGISKTIRPFSFLAEGHPFIPYDNYPAMLHRGERVLTAEENRSFSGGGGVNVYIDTVNARDGAEAGRAGNDIGWAIALRRQGQAA